MRPYHTKIYRRIAPALLCCLALLAHASCVKGHAGKAQPSVVKGVLDLTGWDSGGDSFIDLDGEWEFYWGRLLGPKDFSGTAEREGRAFITVPGLWEGSRAGARVLPGQGSATYRLTIMTGPRARVKTVELSGIYSAYRLWVNGRLADQRGRVDASTAAREQFLFVHNKKLAPFTLHAGANEVVLQVLNYHFGTGGIERPLRLGEGKSSVKKAFHEYALNMIVVGLLMFLSIYNILIFFFRTENRTPLYLGFFSLVWTANLFNLQSSIISDSFSNPRVPYLVDYFTVILNVPLCAMTIHSLYPDEFSRAAVRIAQAAAALFMISLCFTGFAASELVINAFYCICILFIAYGVYAFTRTIMNRRKDAVLFLIGFTPVFIGSVNDILHTTRIINTAIIFQYCMLVLCLLTTLIISRRFSDALRSVAALSRDLEEKNRSLVRADRLKDQMLASTSHELRTPLHGMIGLSESMIESAADSLPPEAVENLSLIASSGHRLSSMVNDLLDMAKIQDEGLALNLRPVDLRSLSEAVVKLSLPLVAGKPLRINNCIGPEVPPVRADEDRLRQVLYNLLGNAVKFTNSGTIELSARVMCRRDEEGDAGLGEMIEVSVSDTGIGVPEEYRERIFEAYQQVDGGDTRLYPGSGLGLAIAKRIVELHGGAIRVEPRQGGGSVFIFTLPALRGAVFDDRGEVIIEGMNDAPETSLLHGDTGEFTGAPVLLVVDDDPVNVRVLRNYFESKNWVVLTAHDGITALERIEQNGAIELVLLDIMMPVMSGYEVCRRIREKRSTGELPVIMLTAKNMIADIDAAFEAGANDYIVKPFHISELQARVSTMLKLRNVRKSASTGITVRDRSRSYSISFGDIVHITSSQKSVVVHTKADDIELPVTMKEIIERLPPDLFMRVHKSHIVNLDFVHGVSHVVSGRYRVRLRDGGDTELPVGPAYLESLRKKVS